MRPRSVGLRPTQSTPYTFFTKRGIDAAVARPLTPSIQAEQAFVGNTEESGVDPLVHGLKHGDVRNSGRWAKVAPLHAGSYDAHDVIVSAVEA